MIILTHEQANQVRGITTDGHALIPEPLVDGTFVLPEVAVTDPAHAPHHEALAALPTRDVAEDEYLAWKLGNAYDDRAPTINEEEAAFLESCSFSPDWPIGTPVSIDHMAIAQR